MGSKCILSSTAFRICIPTSFSSTFPKKKKLEAGKKLSNTVRSKDDFLRSPLKYRQAPTYVYAGDTTSEFTTAQTQLHVVSHNVLTSQKGHRSKQVTEVTAPRILSFSSRQRGLNTSQITRCQSILLKVHSQGSSKETLVILINRCTRTFFILCLFPFFPRRLGQLEEQPISRHDQCRELHFVALIVMS